MDSSPDVVLIDFPYSVEDISTLATILFDVIVVSVTLASVLEIWKLQEGSIWRSKSLVSLMIQQSKLCIAPEATDSDNSVRPYKIRVCLCFTYHQ